MIGIVYIRHYLAYSFLSAQILIDEIKNLVSISSSGTPFSLFDSWIHDCSLSDYTLCRNRAP